MACLILVQIGEVGVEEIGTCKPYLPPLSHDDVILRKSSDQSVGYLVQRVPHA